MKKTLLFLIVEIIISVSSIAQDFKSFNNTLWKGTDYQATDSSLITYSVPEEYPYTQLKPTFNVSVDDVSYIGLYNDKNFWNGNVQFGYIDFTENRKPYVTIASEKKINSFEILPHDADISDIEQTSRYVRFKINKPQQNITIVFNGSYKGDILHLFCNKVEPKPQLTRFYNNRTHYDSRLGIYYFGPGYWDLNNISTFGGKLTVSGNRKVWIEGGAVVLGQINLSGSVTGDDYAKIYGHGIIMTSAETGGNSLNMSWTDAGKVDGIIVFTHGHSAWQTTFTECKNINVSNIKIIGTKYASTDGMDLTRCINCTFDNIFVRSCDDAVAIKGLYDENIPISECPPNTGLTFNRMQLWNDGNNAFGIGAETRASEFSNIKLTNSEILFSYDDPYYHERLDERSAMNICALHGTYFHDITFENIYVNRCERLIGMGFKESFWFGSIQGDQSTDGGIRNVTFKNISCPNTSQSAIANSIRLYGWEKVGTPSKTISDITFDHVSIEGQYVSSISDRHIDISSHDMEKGLVKGLMFAPIQTSIKNTSFKDSDIQNGIYNINGTKTQKAAKGIYIKNGRKYINR